MTGTDFEVVVITSQKDSMDILKTIKDSGIEFELIKENKFAPTSPDVAVQIITTFAELKTVASDLFKRIHAKNGYVDFKTRHRLAREMLAGLSPLQEIEAEDKKDYSYYIFNTAKGLHFWEYDRGEIKHGVLKGRRA
jgi:hypothetical protein